MPEPRLGDTIDDYCTRCRRLTNHSIVSLVNGTPAKVHCRTCYFEHNYKQGKAPPKKPSSRKAALFDAVLSSIVGAPEAPTEGGSQNPEASSQEPEGGSQKPEAGSQKV